MQCDNSLTYLQIIIALLQYDSAEVVVLGLRLLSVFVDDLLEAHCLQLIDFAYTIYCAKMANRIRWYTCTAATRGQL